MESEIIQLNKYLNHKHRALFQSKDEILLVRGSTAAGKSYSIADKLLLNAVIQPERKIRILVMRKTLPSLRASVLPILQERAEKVFHLDFHINRSVWTADCDNLEFIFLSVNTREDFEKLKSITNIDFIWINELPGIRQDDFDEAMRRMRGGESFYNQCIGDFNPVGKFSWVYREFYEKDSYKHNALKYTIEDNHPDFLRQEKTKNLIARLDKLKETNPNAYKIYRLGEWGDLKGIIFNWHVEELPEIGFDDIFYGLDFGYSIDPAALVKIYRRSDKFWVQELIYETGLTNQMLAKKMIDLGIGVNDDCYADSAEPKSIDELNSEPFNLNVKPCDKGPDSVRKMIDTCLGITIYIVDGSENIVKEHNMYVWKEDKDGHNLNEPVSVNDHLMKAIQYGICTHCKRIRLPGFEVL